MHKYITEISLIEKKKHFQSQPPTKSVRSMSESEVECSSNSDEEGSGSESTILKR